MNILSPIDKLSEVDALIDAGADELYGGFVSAGWQKKYSLLGSSNHRYFPNAQIQSENDLKKIIKGAHRRDVNFFLTLNAPYYLERQYGDILDEAGRLLGLGVDAFIVSDLGLILRLRERLPEAAIHLSTLGTVFNSLSASFFGDLGIDRIVFPRELTLKEIAGITAANPGTSFGAFVMVGKCPNIEGFCSFTHNSRELVWPGEIKYRIETVQGGPDAPGIAGAQAGWSRVNRRQACGLCAIHGLRGAGIKSLKIVGRGGPAALKVKVITAVREILDTPQETDAASLKQSGKRLYRQVFGNACNPYVCYFPEIF